MKKLLLGVGVLAGIFLLTADPASAYCTYRCPADTPYQVDGSGAWGMGPDCETAIANAIDNAIMLAPCDVCRVGSYYHPPGGECRPAEGGGYKADVIVYYACGFEICRDRDPYQY